MALTQTDAQYRYNLIQESSILYHLHLYLKPGKNYSSLSQINFSLKKMPDNKCPLFLDCFSNEKTLKGLTINSHYVEGSQIDYDHKNKKLYLPSQKLVQGDNHVGVYLINKYDNDGNGLVSFIDVDNKQYLYSQFQPFHANKVFACFDQPDLKAKIQISIIYPSIWKRVISNEYQTQIEILSHEHHKKLKMNENSLLRQFYNDAYDEFQSQPEIDFWKLISFPKTKLLPTYLYCIIVGDYQQIQLQKQKRYKNIPMSLYCIESLFKYLKQMTELLFETTIQCLKFYEQFFGVPYSFNKYDQAFVHDFRSCAMENAGIVTFTDTYIYRSQVSQEEILDLANTITHQLSHHWFGNLATMKWWDDLWLNQSFAEFISYFALEKIQPNLKHIKYQSSMAAFFARKTWGYQDDQAITTHPIRGQVPNTAAADSIFDGITYAKGASTLKQLMLLMGQDNFSAALKGYFTKYAFKNATLDEFIGALQTHFKFKQFSLDTWKQLWLEKASLNCLQVVWNPELKENPSKFQVHQSPYTQRFQTLRPHKIQIALFKQDCEFDVQQVLIEQKKVNQFSYDGSNQYRAIMLNYGDYTFCKIILDNYSRQFFSSKLTQIPDILTRTLIWRIFYDLVVSSNISSMQYIELFLKNIKAQTSDSILERQYDDIKKAINTYTPDQYKKQIKNRIFYFTYQFLKDEQQKSILNNNRLIIIKQNLIYFAADNLSIRSLYKSVASKNIQFGISDQWQIVVKQFMLNDLSQSMKKQALHTQQLKDDSDTAKQQKQTCQSLLANYQDLRDLLASYKNPKNQLSLVMKKKSIRGWNFNVQNFQSCQHRQQLKNQFFEGIQQASQKLQGDHFLCYLFSISPFVDQDLNDIRIRFKDIKLHGDKFEQARKKIKRLIEDTEKRMRSHYKFKQDL